MANRCSDFQENLPWLLNGTLTSYETINVLNHVMTCTECKKELALLTQIQQKVKHDWHQVPTLDFQDRLWSLLKSDLQDEVKKHENKQPVLAAIKQSIFPIDIIVDSTALAFKAPLGALNQTAKVLFPAIVKMTK